MSASLCGKYTCREQANHVWYKRLSKWMLFQWLEGKLAAIKRLCDILVHIQCKLRFACMHTWWSKGLFVLLDIGCYHQYFYRPVDTQCMVINIKVDLPPSLSRDHFFLAPRLGWVNLRTEISYFYFSILPKCKAEPIATW